MRYEENRLPSDAALVRLYNDAGWVAYTDDLPALRTALENSLYLLCVYEEEELVGLLRARGRRGEHPLHPGYPGVGGPAAAMASARR